MKKKKVKIHDEKYIEIFFLSQKNLAESTKWMNVEDFIPNGLSIMKLFRSIVSSKWDSNSNLNISPSKHFEKERREWFAMLEEQLRFFHQSQNTLLSKTILMFAVAGVL